jgi:gluconolactonase
LLSILAVFAARCLLIILADEPKRYTRVFAVAPDGSLSGGGGFRKVAPGYANGLCVAADGNVWARAAHGVHCIDPDGQPLGQVFIPQRVAYLTFGAPSKSGLVAGGTHTRYAIFLNRRGAGWP